MQLPLPGHPRPDSPHARRVSKMRRGRPRSGRWDASRDADREGRSFPGSAPRPHAAAVVLDYLPGYCQPLRRMIVPAPMNPMPLATCAATREGSRMTCCSAKTSENPKIETTMKAQSPDTPGRGSSSLRPTPTAPAPSPRGRPRPPPPPAVRPPVPERS